VGRSNRKISDAAQLEYATSQARAILTFNATDFEYLHEKWQQDGREYMGIIVSEQIEDVSELVTLDEQYNRLLRLA